MNVYRVRGLGKEKERIWFYIKAKNFENAYKKAKKRVCIIQDINQLGGSWIS